MEITSSVRPRRTTGSYTGHGYHTSTLLFQKGKKELGESMGWMAARGRLSTWGMEERMCGWAVRAERGTQARTVRDSSGSVAWIGWTLPCVDL